MQYEEDEVQNTSHKILGYLMENPDARDTLEGIVDWWLLQQDIKRNVALIKKTVQGLIHRGFLHERKGADGTKYYQLNSEKLSDISEFIKS